MRNIFGKVLTLEVELAYLANGYEWFTSEEFEGLIKPEGVAYHVAAADTNECGKNEMYLVHVGGKKGYKSPTASSGCRLRTGNPDYGR